jgi:hypothetical protein
MVSLFDPSLEALGAWSGNLAHRARTASRISRSIMPVAASLIARFTPATASGALAARIGGQRFSAGRQLLGRFRPDNRSEASHPRGVGEVGPAES